MGFQVVTLLFPWGFYMVQGCFQMVAMVFQVVARFLPSGFYGIPGGCYDVARRLLWYSPWRRTVTDKLALYLVSYFIEGICLPLTAIRRQTNLSYIYICLFVLIHGFVLECFLHFQNSFINASSIKWLGFTNIFLDEMLRLCPSEQAWGCVFNKDYKALR